MEKLANTNNAIKKDVNVELLRTLGCIIVVLVHVNKLPFLAEDKSIVFWKVLFGDGVTIFFMIMGFFLFNNENFIKLLKKTAINILLPAFVLTLVCGIFEDEIANTAANTSYDFISTLKNIIIWQADGGVYHLWYVFSYLKVILLFPMLKLIVENVRVRRYVIGFLMAGLMINDIQVLFNLGLNGISYMFFDASVLCVLIGYEIYHSLCAPEKRFEKGTDKKKQSNKRWMLYGGIALFLECIRMLMQLMLTKRELHNVHFCFWNCGMALMVVAFLVMSVLHLPLKKEGMLAKIIVFVGKHSFNIYLFHFLVLRVLDRRGFSGIVAQAIWGSADYHIGVTNIQELLYLLSRGIVVFGISLSISIIIKLVITYVKKLYRLVIRKA